jgi:glycosyltransferase involved in cell wall biosynthesis
MKILHVCKVFLPTPGGIQVVVNWLCHGLQPHGWNSEVLTTSRTSRPAQNVGDIKVYSSHSYGELLSLPLAPSMLPRFWSLANNYDIICIHYPFPLADIATVLMPFRRFKLVVYWHSEIVSQRLSAFFLAPITHMLLRRATKVVCSSPELIRHSNFLKKHEHKCVVIPFGMPVVDDIKEQLSPDKSSYFLFIGRHVAYKGIDVLLNAYKLMLETVAATSRPILKIAGSGPLLEQHKNLSAELGITRFVDFIEHPSNDTIEQLIANCRCLTLPSILKSEAFGLVQIEAMAKGRPIINTSLESGVPWVARHNHEAITVEPNNVDQLSRALTKISTENAFAEDLGRRSLKRFTEEFEYSSFCQKTDSLYRSLIKTLN